MKSFWTIATLVIGLAVLGNFAYKTATGKVSGSPEEQFVPKEVRDQPGGYRTFHFWHVGYGGYRGGK
ncbi:MAG: hypothetical protein AAGC55_27215 [Myxococcota bacterium]